MASRKHANGGMVMVIYRFQLGSCLEAWEARSTHGHVCVAFATVIVLDVEVVVCHDHGEVIIAVGPMLRTPEVREGVAPVKERARHRCVEIVIYIAYDPWHASILGKRSKVPETVASEPSWKPTIGNIAITLRVVDYICCQ